MMRILLKKVPFTKKTGMLGNVILIPLDKYRINKTTIEIYQRHVGERFLS